MAVSNIPEEHHLLRYVSANKLRRDEDDNVLGCTFEAFRLREQEQYLSAAWVEFFDGERDHQVRQAADSIGATIKVTRRSGFALGNVGRIKGTCAAAKAKVRILHEPNDANPAYATVRQIPRDDIQLLELLASEAWAETIVAPALIDFP